MSSQTKTYRFADSPASSDWADPGYFTQQSKSGNFARVLVQLIKPPKGHKTLPTPAGIVLIILSLGIGSAAYNTSSNILFITLSLLLSSLLLSGILSWINFKSTQWRLNLETHFRAGEITPIKIELENKKKLIPTYSLFFKLSADSSNVIKQLYLKERLDPGKNISLQWLYTPLKRGIETISIRGLESQYPFGFLRKIIGEEIHKDVSVWPARIQYSFKPQSGRRSGKDGTTVLKPGAGSELINLREYKAGDPMRRVHWKASARIKKLMVRELSEENNDAYLIFIETPSDIWNNNDQFEKLCSFAGSLAEDLYRKNKLWGAAINDNQPFVIKRLSDLHNFLEKLARQETIKNYKPVTEIANATIVTFSPGTGDNVNAYVGGNKAGSTEF